jgi:hypothetical protein
MLNISKLSLSLNVFRLVLFEFAISPSFPLGKWFSGPRPKFTSIRRYLGPDFGMGSLNDWRCSNMYLGSHHASGGKLEIMLVSAQPQQGASSSKVWSSSAGASHSLSLIMLCMIKQAFINSHI